MTSKTYKQNLLAKLKNKEYRDAFVSEHIDTGIPFQIKTLRQQRGMKQTDLEQFGMKQALISRLENLNYTGFSIATLKKIASIFNIGLIVRFVPVSDLVKWELNLNADSLKAVSYEDDPYFKEEPKEIETTMPEQKEQALGNLAYMKDHVDKRKEMSVPMLGNKPEMKVRSRGIAL